MPMGMPERQKEAGISGSTLKLVAIFTMLIDHTAATVLDHMLIKKGINELDATSQAYQQFYNDYGGLLLMDQFMRLIGRLAFPIFCFLLVEGLLHTRNKWKYASRLAVFALISEIPFDLAFYSTPFYWGYQNVFFTLLIGLLVLIGFETVQEIPEDSKWFPALTGAGAVGAGLMGAYCIYGMTGLMNEILQGEGSEAVIAMNGPVLIILGVNCSLIALCIWYVMRRTGSLRKACIRYGDLAIFVAGFLLAQVLKTDYSGFGILTIAIMYRFRRNHWKEMLGGCITLTIMSLGEITAFFDLILIRFYNGKRGLNLKYVFYLFYPVHLFLLYLICYFMKII
jgi:hypothetical protein